MIWIHRAIIAVACASAVVAGCITEPESEEVEIEMDAPTMTTQDYEACRQLSQCYMSCKYAYDVDKCFEQCDLGYLSKCEAGGGSGGGPKPLPTTEPEWPGW